MSYGETTVQIGTAESCGCCEPGGCFARDIRGGEDWPATLNIEVIDNDGCSNVPAGTVEQLVNNSPGHAFPLYFGYLPWFKSRDPGQGDPCYARVTLDWDDCIGFCPDTLVVSQAVTTGPPFPPAPGDMCGSDICTSSGFSCCLSLDGSPPSSTGSCSANPVYLEFDIEIVSGTPGCPICPGKIIRVAIYE